MEPPRSWGSPAETSASEDHLDSETDRAAQATDVHRAPGRLEALWRGGLVVLQSILAVAFGAGLFVAFDQLWRWNSIVALVLSVLVILGLVVGVRVVRKTEDIASTLIAVAVGALITLGPLGAVVAVGLGVGTHRQCAQQSKSACRRPRCTRCGPRPRSSMRPGSATTGSS